MRQVGAEHEAIFRELLTICFALDCIHNVTLITFTYFVFLAVVICWGWLFFFFPPSHCRYVHPKLLFSVMVEAVIAYFLDRIPCRLNVKLTLVAQSYLITLLSFKAFLLALWMGITVASCCFLHMTTYCDQADQATPPVDHSVPNVQHVETKASSEDQKEEHKE
ncbi:hypothetical protein Pelo_1776 [Pelomyxa schiedti]|nr:hypothetical protein Pelo_1776 [Pelomyxa schiedti]